MKLTTQQIMVSVHFMFTGIHSMFYEHCSYR